MKIFVARQPIFDSKQDVYAYELLYRNSEENRSNIESLDGDNATSSVITNSILLVGIENMTYGKRAFINFTKKLLIDEIPTLFSNEIVVVEILEDVIPDESIISAVKNMKDKGYLIALDDFVLEYDYLELIKLADIIKIDFILTSKKERREIINRYKKYNIKFLAEKVETIEEFNEAKEMGYSYFQGYFFSKPTIITSNDIKTISTSYSQILKEVIKDEPEYDLISNIIESDIALTYKLLKLINSPAFYTSKKVTSISRALVMLGFKEIRKWISIIMMRDLGKDKPDEIMRVSLIRGKMGEGLARLCKMNSRKDEMFIIGIFSMIDTLMDRTLFDILSEMPFETGIIEALLGYDNELRKLFKVILAYEVGDWDKMQEYTSKLGIDVHQIPDIYFEALKWTNEIFEA
ncbi:EAL and HDOD domain-containing protein [Helicovermis profundi]|uniref:HDOD domain-containing protein n=1 Tax=Helicovermis profundi TaxID=3065157 RepID=A0AAU9EEX6_9FIRM|nr:HDOD domain-containing protein [Clostridia bacterium S502]